MFTTGVHGWLAAAVGCHGIAWLLYARRLQMAGRLVLALALVLQSLYLVGRGWLGGVFIPNPVVEGPFLLPWCLALITLVSSLVNPQEKVGGLMALVVVFSLFSLFYAKGMIPPTPKKLSAWAILFFLTESMAHALFYISALVALFGKRPAWREVARWVRQN